MCFARRRAWLCALPPNQRGALDVLALMAWITPS